MARDVNFQSVILYPIITEDAIAIIEAENKLLFIVNRNAAKSDVKGAVEKLYQVEVDKVNLTTTPQGQKKAFVKLKPKYKASDVAIKIGIL